MNRNEEALHIAVADYLRLALPPDWIWTTVEHGGKVGKAEARKRKARGVLAGWPDIQIMPPWGMKVRFYGHSELSDVGIMFIEMKSRTGRVSNAQKDVHRRLKDAGYDVAVCRSVEDVERFLRDCGVPLRATCAAP